MEVLAAAASLHEEDVRHIERPTSATCSTISWLDVDAIDGILRRGGLETAGRLASTCEDMRAACAPLLSRVYALTRPPFGLPPEDIFGANARLILHCSCIGDVGAITLASACSSGAFYACERLYLNHSRICDAGLCALAAACGRAALPTLTLLSLNGNHIGDAGLSALSLACAHQAALPKLWDLWLSGNQIGDIGLAALVAASNEHGAFAELGSLTLSQNQIGARGVEAIATALNSSGAFPKLKELGMDNEHAQLMKELVVDKESRVDVAAAL